jgi:hypothetical protein
MTTYLNREKKINSSRLYSTPNFVIGMGSIFNVAGSYFDYNYSNSGMIADKKAIVRDWEVVGSELKNAIHIVAHE